MDGIVFHFLLPKLRELRKRTHVPSPARDRVQAMSATLLRSQVKGLHCEVLPMEILLQLITLVNGAYDADLFRDLVGGLAMNIDGHPYICISPAAARLPDADLAFIVAHECGHLALGHTAAPGEQSTHAAWRNPIGKLALAAEAIDGLRSGTGLLEGLLQVGSKLHGAARMCMQDELDADRFAVRRMARHGFGVNGAVNVLRHFEELEHEEPDVMRMMQTVFGTHPAPTERILNIQTSGL